MRRSSSCIATCYRRQRWRAARELVRRVACLGENHHTSMAAAAPADTHQRIRFAGTPPTNRPVAPRTAHRRARRRAAPCCFRSHGSGWSSASRRRSSSGPSSARASCWRPTFRSTTAGCSTQWRPSYRPMDTACPNSRRTTSTPFRSPTRRSPSMSAGFVEDLTPLSMVEVFRFQPLVVTIGILFAFTLLARRILSDDVAFIASVAAFAFIPFSYEWMIMGGGITRSLGLLFAVLALCEVHRMYTTRSPWCIVTVGLLAGMCGLSHLEMASFLAFSTALFFGAYGRSWASARATAARRRFRACRVGSVVDLRVRLPWRRSFSRRGHDRFTRAGEPAPDVPRLPADGRTTVRRHRRDGAARHRMVAGARPLALAGVGARVRLLDPRGFGNVACVPIALLAGVAVASVLLPMLAPASRTGAAPLAPSVCRVRLPFPLRADRRLGRNAAAIDGLSSRRARRDGLDSLNTPAAAGFAGRHGSSVARGRRAEWFPVLGGRRSVATVQGSEWTRGRSPTTSESYTDLQLCADGSGACIDDWQSEYGSDYDYVYVPKAAELQPGVVDHPDECCAALRFSLRSDERYSVVFDGEGATVFRRVE